MKPSFDWQQWRDRWQRARDQLPPLDAAPGPFPPLPELPAPQQPEIIYACPICLAIQMEQVDPIPATRQRKPDGTVEVVDARVAARDPYYPFADADAVALCQHHLRTIELIANYNLLFDQAGNPVYDHYGDWRLETDRNWMPFSAFRRAEQIRGWKRHGRRLLRHRRGLNWMDGLDTPEADRLRWNEEGEY